MPDNRIVQIADVLVNYSLSIQPGQKVLIRGESLAEPLIQETYRAALRAGALVTPQIGLPGLEKIFMDEANDEQLQWIQPMSRLVTEEYDALLAISASSNTREGTQFDPEKLALRGKANQPIQDRFFERAAKGEFKWVATLFPTQAFAQDADMAFEDYAEFVYHACLPDSEDPIGFWKNMEARQEHLVQYLNGVKTLRLVAKDTDLTVGVKDRKWINCAGRENFPDGEVFTGPIETETEGHVRFTYPAVHQGNEVTDAQLWFEKGRIVKAAAQKGKDFLLATLDRDEGARILGEFAIGTNPGITRFTRNTLFDEKIQGTVHMAVGMSYPDSGGTNQSQVHWDMICDMREGGKLYADDELIYENGAFTIDFE
ncbi:MAG: aminopeptidase [bacterium]|nr:aminopeptidase [bacterium]